MTLLLTCLVLSFALFDAMRSGHKGLIVFVIAIAPFLMTRAMIFSGLGPASKLVEHRLLEVSTWIFAVGSLIAIALIFMNWWRARG